MKVGTAVVATLNVKPGATSSTTARLNDGQSITTSSYCYTGSVLGGGCATPWVSVATPYQVVCPAWAQAELSNSPCNCTPDLPAIVTLTAPAGSPRFYRGFVSLNKGVAISKDLSARTTTISTGKLAKGTNVVISFTVYSDAAHKKPMLTKVLKDITVNRPSLSLPVRGRRYGGSSRVGFVPGATHRQLWPAPSLR